MPGYTDKHARAGIRTALPKLETFANQYRGYEIRIEYPEYSSVCPKTGLPDCGTITIEYLPERWCVELKSLKMYLLAYRNLGIFYENAVNRILDDFCQACHPVSATVTGDFTARGGMRSRVVARWPRQKR